MKKAEVIKIEDMSLEALQEIANSSGEAVEKTARMAVSHAIRAGRALTAAKLKVPHGQWLAWLKAHWNYSQQTASRYITIANYSSMSNLNQAEDINHALRIIADDPETPKRERKTGQVTVVDPEESSAPAGEEPAEEHESDTPSIDPPTNRKTSKDSRKVSESKKPKTQPIAVTAELVDEPAELPTVVRVDDRDGLLEACCRVVPPTAILRYLINICPEESSAKLGKQLRDAADTVNPPTKFRAPDVDEVAAYCEERRASGKTTARIDPEHFVAHYRSNGWKLNNGNKMQDWKAAVITWEKRENSNGRGNRNSAALTGADW